MSNQFADALLAKATTVELQQIYNTHRPDYECINTLVTTLMEQQSYDGLEVLLTIITENKDDTPPLDKLNVRIHTLLLVYALSQANKMAVTATLNKLDELLNDNRESLWSDVLPHLLQWINTPHQAADFLHLLQALPESFAELLYERLFETVEGKPLWLDTSIQFLLNTHRNLAFDSPIHYHLQKLALSVLLSPITCNDSQLKSLTLILSINQLVGVTFQLRAIAATYASDNKNRENTRFSERRQLYLNNYETLVTALTVRATTSTSEYQNLIFKNRELANLLMTKRFKILTSPKQQKELIYELLGNCAQFDWQDSQFNSLALEHIVALFAALSLDEISLLFKRYFAYHSKKNQRDIIRFLDIFFEKTNNTEAILRCIDNNDNEDKTFTINFLTQSSARNSALTEALLKRLDEDQLIKLCGHVVALKQILQQDGPSLAYVYCHVLCEKIKISNNSDIFLKNWAVMVADLPENVRDELIELVFAEFKDNQALQLVFASTLLQTVSSTSMLFTDCYKLLKLLSLPDQVILLKNFSCERLLEFYLHMMRNQASNDDFNGFVELFKDFSRQAMFIYLLQNTPFAGQTFLARLLPLLDSKNIITLLELMVSQAETNKDYSVTLELLLIHVAQLLQETLDETNPIHHWVDCSNSMAIAKQMLSNPTCFYSLASRSSHLQNFTPNFLQGFVITSAARDLKLRAIRILDMVIIDEKFADDLALRLLSHFRETPKDLQTIFVNLQDATRSLNKEEHINYVHNYDYLLRACWRLLQAPNDLAFDEKQCISILTSQMTSSHRFDVVLANLANNLTENEDSFQSALYLAQLEHTSIGQIQQETLATILLKSVQETSIVNWQKVTSYFNDVDKEKTQLFIKIIIAKIKLCLNNPFLVEKTLQFIINLDQFEAILPLLNDDELQWLVKECNPNLVIEKFPHWLDLLLVENHFAKLQGSALLALLPQNPEFLDLLYQRAKMSPHLHSLFIQFSNEKNAANHFIALFQQINKETVQQKRNFIASAQVQIQAQATATIAPAVINMVLLSLPDLDPRNRADRKLIRNQLRFFTKLVNNQALEPRLDAHFTRELQQLVLNTLIILTNNDNGWASVLLNSKSFAKLALFWLAEVDEKTIQRHPFTQILLDNAHLSFNTILIDSAAYQHFIKLLLTNPPRAMTDGQFSLLFATLSGNNQQALALSLLNRPTLDDVQWSSLITLSRALPVNSLYDIYQRSKTRFVFVDLLVRHPDGIAQLASKQKNNLLGSITSAKQVLRILDSQSPPSTKVAFVNALFTFLKETNTALSSWFDTMNVDSQTIAALANYTHEPVQKAHLQQVIDDNGYQQQEMQRYLQNPNLEMRIEAQGLLFKIVRNAWLNPWQGWLSHPDLLSTLDYYTAAQALKAQFECLRDVQQLDAFYEPLNGSQEVATEILTSARWIYRLPLLAEMMEFIHEYQSTDCQYTKIAIESSNLYQQIICPLLKGANLNLEPLFNDATELLGNLQEHLETVNPALASFVQHIQRNFLQKAATIEHFSSPKLYSLFNPRSYFAKIKKGRVILLQQTESTIISNAPEHHRQWLEEHHYSGQQYFSDLLLKMISQPSFNEDIELQQWLLNTCLFSPIANNISDLLLEKVLGHFSIDNFAQETKIIQHNLTKINLSFKRLEKLTSLNCMQDLFDHLFNLPDNILTLHLQAVQFAQLPYLTNLLSLVLHAKNAKIEASNISALFLSKQFGNYLDLEWIHNELKSLAACHELLVNRCHELAIAGFKYQNDAHNGARLTNLASSFLKQHDIKSLTFCLNSFAPSFTLKNTKITAVFLQTLNKLLCEPSLLTPIINLLDDALLSQIILATLPNLAQHQSLLHLLVQAGKGGKCYELLHAHLKQLLAVAQEEREPELQDMSQLTNQQLSRLNSQSLIDIFTAQHLIFYINPKPELGDWQKNNNEIADKNRALFCADASMYATLSQLNQNADKLDSNVSLAIKALLQAGFACLSKETYALSYFNTLDSLSSTEPAPYFHYLCLVTFFSKDDNALLIGFITWLQKIDNKQLSNAPWLEKLLAFILDKNLLTTLCQNLQHYPALNEPKSTWLFANIMRLQPVDQHLINNIVIAFSWTWLSEQIKTSPINRLGLLQTVLKQEPHCQAILANEQSILAFLALLMSCDLPTNDLLDLQLLTTNTLLKSLIASHLLTRLDYLQKLQGRSFLAEINGEATYKTPRLRALISQVKLQHLPLEVLQQFPPETAASLICSVKNFHLLNENRLSILLQRTGVQRDFLINYWLRQYAHMPNSDEPLAVLAQKYSKQLLLTLAAMVDFERRPIILILIQQLSRLDKFTTTCLNEFNELCDESHLTYAIRLYLHGRQQDSSLINFITILVKNRLAKNKELSSQTIQLLVRLSEDESFTELRANIGKATGDYLRSSALFADCSIFYDDGRINIKRMHKAIPLTANQSASGNQTGFLQSFFHSWKKILPGTTDETDSSNRVAENPLLSKLMTRFESIKAINYFLIHYLGNQESLRQCLDDYLNYFEFEDCSAELTETLTAISWLIIRPEIASNLRTTLFNCFLNHPKLLNGTIALNLLIFDTEKVLKHFGMNRNYKTLIKLCVESLKLLDKIPLEEREPKLESALEKALQEAHFEASLAKVSGFLCDWRIWIKRCFFYGLQGWFTFKPKQPEYVAPFDDKISAVDEKESTNVVMDALGDKQQAPEKLEYMLTKMNKNASLPLIINIYNALIIYELQRHNPNEFAIRKTVDSFFEILLERAKVERDLNHWFCNHREAFITNRQQLIALCCKSDKEEELASILGLISKNFGEFNQMVNELGETREPERLPIDNEPIPIAAAPSTSYAAIAGTLGSITSYFWKPAIASIESTPGTTPTAAPSGWFSWFSK